MRRVMLMCLAAVLLTTTVGTAATVWNPAANSEPNDFNEDGSTYWGIAANWTNGIPGTVAPAETKAVFNVAGAVECRVADAQTCKDLVMGDGGSAVALEDNLLRIMDGGTLTTTGGWMAVGYNRPAKLVVEEGGLYDHAGHFWWGGWTGGEGVIEINGGTVINHEDFSMGGHPSAGGVAYVYLNAGLLSIDHWGGPDTAIHDGSVMDIRFGTFEIYDDGDQTGQVNDYITAGKIIGYGGLTTPVAVYADGVTTVTAPHPLQPSPATGEVVVLDGVDNNVLLSWAAQEPNAPGDTVYYDVWFGVDPNKLAGASIYEKVAPATTGTSVTVLGLSAETYYWQVDTYIYGAEHINDANMIEGPVFYFDALLDGSPSIVIDTPDTLTWSGEPVTLIATVTDDLESASSVVWSSPVDANIIYTNESYVYPTATVTVTSDSHQPNTIITATVSDGNPLGLTGSDTVLVDFAESACQGAGGGFMHLWEIYIADLDRNCIVDLADFAVLAGQWLDPYQLTEPIPIVEE